MSDRIDDLVAICTKQMNACNGCPNLLAITELATIAREAEARTAEWIDRCYQSEERALKAEAMCEWLAEEVSMGVGITVDDVLAAAGAALMSDVYEMAKVLAGNRKDAIDNHYGNGIPYPRKG